MCIIVNKPKGVEMPTKEILKNCFTRNSDGAGLMFSLNGKVQIHKGFMDFDSFHKYIKKLDKVHNLKDKAIIMHFRISTGGNVDAGNCHPYPVTKNEESLRKEHVVTDLGMVHNGIIQMYNTKYGVLNDTQQFIMGCVSTLKDLNEHFLEDKASTTLLGKISGSSRLCFLDGKENVTMIGSWYEDNGIYYSNTTYKSYTNYGYYYDGWNGKIYGRKKSKTKDFEQIMISKSEKPQTPLTWNEYITCLESLTYLTKGEIIKTKLEGDDYYFEIKENYKYAVDTFFNLWEVDRAKHDIVMIAEEIEFATDDLDFKQ